MSETKEKIGTDDAGGNIFLAGWRALKLGLSNFRRNKFLSIATILVMAVIIFIFNVILAIQFVSNQALQALSERVDIVVYLHNDISLYDANRLREDISEIGGVTKVKYTSREEALEIVGKTHPKTAEFLKKFNLSNPLPPSLSIVTSSPEDYEKIQQYLEQPDNRNLMSSLITEGYGGENIVISAVAKNISGINSFVRQIIFWMVLVFVLGGTLVVINAIQLTIFTRKNEIYIMRLVGATPNFIRMPFVFEGVLYGVFAVLLSFIILGLLGNSIRLEDGTIWELYGNLRLDRVFVAELAITTVLAVISSFAAVQKYLKGKLTVN
jgi:cell division transport system permease protein